MKPHHLYFFFLAFSCSLWTSAQEPSPLSIESFAYPFTEDGYHFGEFQVKYGFNDNTSSILRGFHEKTPLSEYFRTQLLLRKRVVNKLHALAGLQMEWDLGGIQNGTNLFNPEGDTTRKEAYFGLEYEPKPNLLIHAGYRHLLNKPKFAAQGFNSSTAKGALNIGSKWKF